jgi:hypothetical protein
VNTASRIYLNSTIAPEVRSHFKTVQFNFNMKPVRLEIMRLIPAECETNRRSISLQPRPPPVSIDLTVDDDRSSLTRGLKRERDIIELDNSDHERDDEQEREGAKLRARLQDALQALDTWERKHNIKRERVE